MKKFLDSLFSGYDNPELMIEVRCLKPHWSETHAYPPRAWFRLDKTDVAADYCDMQSDRWDVYVGVLPRVGRSGSQNDVIQANTLFADIDGGEEGVGGALRLLDRAELPTPNIINISGSGIHCYWLLSQSSIVQDSDSRLKFKFLLRRLAKKIGGAEPSAHSDYASCEVARILRVPGTFNHKIEGNPRAVKTIMLDTGERHSIDWFGANLPMEEQKYQEPYRHESYTPSGFISEGLHRWARIPIPVGERYRGLMSAAAWLIKDCGLSQGDALLLLETKANASGQGQSITRKKLESMVRWPR